MFSSLLRRGVSRAAVSMRPSLYSSSSLSLSPSLASMTPASRLGVRFFSVVKVESEEDIKNKYVCWGNRESVCMCGCM